MCGQGGLGNAVKSVFQTTMLRKGHFMCIDFTMYRGCNQEKGCLGGGATRQGPFLPHTLATPHSLCTSQVSAPMSRTCLLRCPCPLPIQGLPINPTTDVHEELTALSLPPAHMQGLSINHTALCIRHLLHCSCPFPKQSLPVNPTTAVHETSTALSLPPAHTQGLPVDHTIAAWPLVGPGVHQHRGKTLKDSDTDIRERARFALIGNAVTVQVHGLQGCMAA